jgi:hypothetical protein
MATKWLRLKERSEEAAKKLPKGFIYVSNNSKTGMSLNTAIHKTCRPTAACAKYCYGLNGPIAFPLAVARQLQNAARFDELETAAQSEVDDEAARIHGAILYERRDFFRVFGVGDLQPGSVRVINALARKASGLPLWVSSRKPELAGKLDDVPNLHLMLSCDSTTKPADLKKMRDLVKERKKQAFLAYVQQGPDDTPPDDVRVVFAEHGVGGRRADWTSDRYDVRTCPATIRGGAEHNDACSTCRVCFDVKRRATHLKKVKLRVLP